MVLLFDGTIFNLRDEIMKKTICIVSAAVLMLFSFAGCGKDNKSDGDTAATETTSSDLMEDITKAVDDLTGDTSAADGMDDGTVTDEDGIIGNENSDATNSNDNNADNSDDNNNAGASNPSDTLL